jgi:transcriptional regulator with XRE-family HTH domain
MSIKKLPSISQNIKTIRKKLNLSQDKLSKLAGVAYNTVVKIESGENHNPTIDTLKKIADVLNVGIDDLMK